MDACAAIAAAVLSTLQGCTLGRTVLHNFADLDDHRIFSNRVVACAAGAPPLRTLAGVPRFLDRMEVPDGHGNVVPLAAYLARTDTAAFVVLHSGRIAYESYARGYNARSLLGSFSIAKSIVATLVGMAVAAGRIDLDATVGDYRRDFAGTAYEDVTIRQLLTMTSGVADAPSLLPGRSLYYYGDDLREIVREAVAQPDSDRAWRYSESDVQMLAFVLEAAVGMRLSNYLAEKLWKPLGMEADALWALDREGGTEKAFCCLSARARDFARLGRLFAKGGRWNGEQVVPARWAAHAALPGIAVGDGYTHRHLWWHPAGGAGDYYAYGHNGQYLYVHPTARVVIVKFSESNRQDPLPMFRAIASALQVPANLAEIGARAGAR